MNPRVRASRLVRCFRGRRGSVRAVDGVSFDAGSSGLCVVRGPSGCGKSTLLNLVGLLDQPTSGQLWIDEVETSRLEGRATALLRRQKIRFLFQDAGLLERMTVIDNVLLPLVYRGVAPSSRRSDAAAAMERAGIAHLAHENVSLLSGGERQRVGLARAVASRPALLVCDEPTASLDEENGQVVVALLRDLAADGVCIVCSSHDPSLIAAAGQVLQMSFGRLAE